jgi:hypothetical protein
MPQEGEPGFDGQGVAGEYLARFVNNHLTATYQKGATLPWIAMQNRPCI